MTEQKLQVVARSDVFDPDTFWALAMHIALGSVPELEEEPSNPSDPEA